MRQTVTEP